MTNEELERLLLLLMVEIETLRALLVGDNKSFSEREYDAMHAVQKRKVDAIASGAVDGKLAALLDRAKGRTH